MKKAFWRSVSRGLALVLLGAILLPTLSGCYTVEVDSGIRSVSINEEGELVVTYIDGNEENLGRVVGKDGEDGIDGKDGLDGIDGEDGKDGMDGKDGKDGEDGELIIGSGESSEGVIAAATAKGLTSAVSISCYFEKTVQGSMGGFPGFGSNNNTSTQQYYSRGAGVIYKLDREAGSAFIITNYHVVYDASSNTDDHISDEIYVFLYGSEYSDYAIEAEYVGGSMYYDIAVLYVKESELLKSSTAEEASLSKENSISVGSEAIAIGNPEGIGTAASYGIVSVDSEYLTMNAADGTTSVSFRVMRIDTAVNSGNSGGGLYNTRGELIGIVNAKVISSDVENIGYAIPVTLAKAVADNIIDNCFGKENTRVIRPMLGIILMSTNIRSEYDKESASISIIEDVTVSEVTSTGKVAELIKVDDLILSAKTKDGTVDITRRYMLIDLMLTLREGESLTLTVIRDGEEMTLDIPISEDLFIEY